MPKKLPSELLDRVIAALSDSTEGVAIGDLARRLAPLVSRRSLQRKLALWSETGAIRATGARKGRRYFAAQRPSEQMTAADLLVAPTSHFPALGEASIPLSSEGAAMRALVRRHLVDRAPVGYQRAFLDSYESNATSYLPEILRRHLHEIGRTSGAKRPAGTYARRILERLLIDLSWNSSRLEGNTYSLLETQQLIRDNQIAPGKDPRETQMILNHKAAIELLVGSPHEIGIDRYTIQNLHALLADNLLDDPAQAGRLREGQIGIAGSTYIPLAIPQLVDELFGRLLEKAAANQDPFEQSFFLMVHLAYLQPFADVNKRTSRLAANIPLIKKNLVPLSFMDVPEQTYIDGLIGVYELNRIELLRDAFAWAYERSCRRYKVARDSLPEPDLFRLKYRKQLIEVVAQAVRDQVKPTPEQILPLAANRIPQADLQRFIALAVSELSCLHEGNIARFRLKPSELHEWQKFLPQQSV